MVDILRYLALALLLAFSAFFSGSEIAVAKANALRMKNRAESGDKRARAALKVMDRFTETISTILVGNNLVNIAFSSIVTLLAVEVWFPGGYTARTEALTTAVMTVMILIFGEIVPKIICTQNADRVALLFSVPLRWCSAVFAPVVKSVSAIMKKLSPIWTPKEAAPTATTEELCTIVEEIEDEGIFTEKEGELIKSAIEFSETTAREIMIPRVDVMGFDIDSPLSELRGDADLLSFARFPVYRESLDDIVGILSTKRFIRASLENPDVKLEDLLYEPVYVHMTRTISSILAEFRRKRCQMAIVIDEYGGTMGILTLEDIVEEIVGEIYDERDEIEEDVVQRGNSFEVDGSTTISDCFEDIGFEDDDFESEYTTVGGWATEVLDKFPEKGDTFTYKNLAVTVLEAEDRRVEKLRIDLIPMEEDDD